MVQMMTCPITDNKLRHYPLKQPNDWTPKVPRWMLEVPEVVKELTIAYVGVQHHGQTGTNGDTNCHEVRVATSPQFDKAASAIEDWTQSAEYRPVIVDRFKVLSGRDIPGSLEWACYWTSHESANKSLGQLDLAGIYQSSSAPEEITIGLWLEVINPKLTHFETNYSGDDYQPGLASLPGTSQVPHNLTGYWGAARDRIRASAHNDFSDSTVITKPSFATDTTKLHLKGSNLRTIAHIRSGQFWQNCSAEEGEAYEQRLEMHLRRGLDDIYERPGDLGDFGLRFVRNIPQELERRDEVLRETCAAGFFRSLADLESWAKDCPSHHKIYGGAISHKQKYGKDAKMRTWHEVCVLEPGDAKWEYVGCVEDTGTISFQQSEACEINS